MPRLPRYLRPVVRLIKRIPTLLVALIVAIAVTLLLTAVSVSIYANGGFAKFDLSRPGFERERVEVRTTESPKTYDTTSPVTTSAIDDFLQEYDQRVKELQEYGKFNDQVLEDHDLQLIRQGTDVPGNE